MPRARFEVFKAERIKIQVLQYITPCTLVNRNRRFEGSCLHQQCLCIPVLLDSSETSVSYLTQETAPYRKRCE